MRLRFRVDTGRNLTSRMTSQVKGEVKQAVRTIAQDLARTASETAPHLTGDLEDSYAIDYQFGGNKITATIEFAVYKGSFNYAIAMHEWTYNLGAGSQAKSGGTGMSGRTYTVGRKYLTRVLEGESVAYTNYIRSKIHESLRGGR